MYVDINGHQISCTTSLGFPQGGVCSAKFWIIAFNTAISILNEHGVLGLGFADDCVTLIGGTNLHQMMNRIQKVITKLEEWGLTCGLSFNLSKTVVVIFTKKESKKPGALNPIISDGFTQLLYNPNLPMLLCRGDIEHNLLTNILYLIN